MVSPPLKNMKVSWYNDSQCMEKTCSKAPTSEASKLPNNISRSTDPWDTPGRRRRCGRNEDRLTTGACGHLHSSRWWKLTREQHPKWGEGWTFIEHLWILNTSCQKKRILNYSKYLKNNKKTQELASSFLTQCGSSHDWVPQGTLWWFNIAVEHGPFLVDFPISPLKMVIDRN